MRKRVIEVCICLVFALLLGIGAYQAKAVKTIVGEAKYNTSKLSTLKDGTKQMSKEWIGGKRLEEAIGTEKANLIGNNYERNLYNIKKNGSLNFKVLNN